MPSTNYEFSARGKLNTDRPRLLSGWTLAGFAIAVLILLALIFSKHSSVQQVLRDQLGDPVSTNYLINLLRTDPDNLELRLLLAEHKIFLNELNEVPEILAPVLSSTDSNWHIRGLLAEYKFVTQLYLRSEKLSESGNELLVRRRTIFAELVPAVWPMQTLVYLASQANDLQEATFAEQLYREIRQGPVQMSASWYAAAALRELGLGHYKLSSLLYFIARQEARSLGMQREYFFAGIKALMANSMFVEAMVSADLYVGSLESDPATLYFLAKTARSANDTVRADRYARKMLHLSSLENEKSWFESWQFSFIGTAHAASDDLLINESGKIRPYDKKTYELAYEIFLGNGNLADAFRVADAAIRQVPKDAAWHKRLAQVAEWHGKPAIALREWWWLTLHGGGDAAMLEVFRLAPGLGAYDTLIDAWKLIALKKSLEDDQWRTLSDLFEQAGDVRDGIQYFEAQYAKNHNPLMLELAAYLAKRSGEDEHANKLYWMLIGKHGENEDRLLKVSIWYLQNGRYQEAYDLLNKYSSKVEQKNFAYWKLLADLAWQLQNDMAATENYRRLAASESMSKDDFVRLIYLLGTEHQEESAALAELAYTKFDDLEMLLKALEIHAARHDLKAQRRLFETVNAQHGDKIIDDPRFLLARAQFYQTTGNLHAARRDYYRAITIAPNDVNTVSAILWFLIDAHEHPALREIVQQIIAEGKEPGDAYWGVLAAAYQELGQPAKAVECFVRQKINGEADFLWLVAYADALEQNHQQGLAWRVRQQAWKLVQRDFKGKSFTLPFSPELLASARLVLLNRPYDPALDLIRSVLRQDGLIKRDVAVDQLTNEFVLGWAASKEQNANAKAWMWRRYGLALKRPLWAESMVALAENDTEKLNRLMEDQANGITLHVRHDAALAIGQKRYAQTIAFEGLTLDPVDNEIHARLTDDALAAASQANFEMRDEQIGALHNIVQLAQFETPISTKMRLAVEAGEISQSSSEALLLTNPPSTERVVAMTLKLNSGFGHTAFLVRNRQEYDNTTELGLAHVMDITQGLNLQLNAEKNAEATESNDLRVFGMRDELDARLRYAISKRDYISVQPTVARYYTQRGEYLGNGNHLSWEAGHHIRLEYPDLTIRVTGDYLRFSNEGVSPLTLPGDADIHGACFDIGKSYQTAYTRAWRPFMDACATDNSVSGAGYNATFGLAGSVAGHDNLSLMFHQEFGGETTTNDLARELTLHYRYYFDRY